MDFNCKKINGLGERIRNCREIAKLSRAAVSERLNVATSTLQAWESGEREPPASGIVGLAEILNTSINYLLYGVELQNTDIQVNTTPDVLQDEYDGSVCINDYRNIFVSAGFGRFNEEVRNPDYVRIDSNWVKSRGFKASELAMFKVSGDSMYPTLKDEEDIIIHTAQKKLKEGKIYVINHQGAMWVKKIRFELSCVKLISDNPMYPPIPLTWDEANALIVIGQVVRGYRDF